MKCKTCGGPCRGGRFHCSVSCAVKARQREGAVPYTAGGAAHVAVARQRDRPPVEPQPPCDCGRGPKLPSWRGCAACYLDTQRAAS